MSSGAYSLAESYLLTVEAFTDMAAQLDEDGILVATRWLQTPPSESVKLLATVVAALERMGVDEPAKHIVMLRGIQTATVLAKLHAWSARELAQVRAFAERPALRPCVDAGHFARRGESP